jgi:hypothetical protein
MRFSLADSLEFTRLFQIFNGIKNQKNMIKKYCITQPTVYEGPLINYAKSLADLYKQRFLEVSNSRVISQQFISSSFNALPSFSFAEVYEHLQTPRFRRLNLSTRSDQFRHLYWEIDPLQLSQFSTSFKIIDSLRYEISRNEDSSIKTGILYFSYNSIPFSYQFKSN